MPRLPVITGKDAIETFKKAGFYEASVVGSHHVLKRKDIPIICPFQYTETSRLIEDY